MPDVYSNTVRFSAGPYDFLLDFGVQDPVVDPQKPPAVRSLARVRMSPQHALVLNRALADAIVRYQNQMGPINVPPAIFRQMGIEP